MLGVVVPAAGGLGPAVDVDGLPGDVAGELAGQEDGGAGHLVDVPGPPHRHGEAEPPVGVGRDGGDALGHGDVGRQRVDPDAERRQLQGGGLGVVDDAGLGGGVGRVARRGADALDGGDAHDAAADLVLDHDASHPLRAQDDVLEVGPVERIPAVLRGLEERRREHAARVVDQDAHGAELGHRLLEGAVDLGRVADVGRKGETADLLGGRGGAGVGVASPRWRPSLRRRRSRWRCRVRCRSRRR